MQISFAPYDPTQGPELAAWLAAERWPFHGCPQPTLERAQGWVDEGSFHSAEDRSTWLLDPAGRRVGLLVLHELGDLTPVFDLRVIGEARRRGVGRQALSWLAREVFEVHDKPRVEAHVRADNLACRGLLRSQGWVQEAHYRQAWPDSAGRLHDASAYALLREDWRAGTRTPVLALDP